MKASELINELTKLMEEFGDLPVRYQYVDGDTEVEVVHAYNDNGEQEGACVEIFLH